MDCGLIGTLPIGCPVTDVGIGATLLDIPHLEPSAPNPFGHFSRITCTVPDCNRPARVQLRIYDPLGRLVRTLVDSSLPAGRYEVTWDSTDEKGKTVTGGVYFYRLRVNDETETRRTILLR